MPRGARPQQGGRSWRGAAWTSALVVPFEAATDRLTPRLLTRPFGERHQEQRASQFPIPPRHEQQRREEHAPPGPHCGAGVRWQWQFVYRETSRVLQVAWEENRHQRRRPLERTEDLSSGPLGKLFTPSHVTDKDGVAMEHEQDDSLKVEAEENSTELTDHSQKEHHIQSKLVWDEFEPIFLNDKVQLAECMSWHRRLFSCLRRHLETCMPS
ncbi:hypothetical protein ZWY2020_024584 [Hordeum vulgare]|nr:hypothetical protein ZWY2020_024584 [Hordeum vulgare]